MSAPGITEYAFARCDRLKSLAELRKAQKHADRAKSARCVVRPGTNPIDDQVRWSLGAGDGAFDLIAGWRLAKGSARERAKAPICLHLILGVSPSWISTAGGLHDRTNPANVALFKAARNFVEREIGTVAAARLDLDEVGGGVVDVFAVPIFGRQRRLRKDGTRSPENVLEISANKAFARLCEVTGEKGDYAALQTSWADYAQRHLDHRLARGERKSKTGRWHLETPAFKEMMRRTTILKAEADAAQAVLDQLKAERQALDEMRRSLEWREASVARQEEQCRTEIDREVQAITRAWAKCASGQQLSDADRALMRSPMAAEASNALQAAISAVEAAKVTHEKRAEELLREEERVNRLKNAADDWKRDLSQRQVKIDRDEEANRTRETNLRMRATDIEKKESRLGIAQQEAQAASKHAADLIEEAESLKGRIMAALDAIMRLWQSASKQGDEEILNHADVASLAESGNLIHEEIESRRRGLESMRQKVGAEIEQMRAQSQERGKQRSELQTLKADLDERDAEISRKKSELDFRGAKITEREIAFEGTVAKHESRVAADLDRIRRLVLELRRRLIGAPIAGDQATFADPMFRNIYEEADATRKALDADIASKRKTRDELVAESEALERQSAKIKGIGAALAAWLGGERGDALKKELSKPEAKPFVDAFNGTFAQMMDHRKRRKAEMTQLTKQIAELHVGKKAAEENQAEADKRLAETKAEADVLATLIEANKERAERFERNLTKNIAYLEKLAAQNEETSPVPKLMKQIDAAKAQVAEVPRLRRPQRPAGMELD